MKISIALMCHVSRVEFIPYLKSKLGECKVFIDDGHLGVKKNSIRCWASFDKTADYHLVIQDDAIICEDFFGRCKKYLDSKKEIVSFFMSKRLKEENLEEDENFFYRNWLTGAVGLAIKTEYIPELLSFMNSQRMNNDDTIIANFFKKKGIKISYSKPSLVDHRHGIESIVEKKIVTNRRTAYENISL